MTSTSIRFRIDFDRACSIGFGKIALLEGIARTGSLSQAARELDMSYRRAWLLLDSMNSGFDTPVVTTMAGGSGGGGAQLTEFGRELIAAFRELQPRLQSLAEQSMRPFASHLIGQRPKSAATGRKQQRQSLARSTRSASSK